MNLKVAVITPYWKEKRTCLERCINSVKSQSSHVDHFLVADGHPQGWMDSQDVNHIILDRAHGDYGNTPRCIGAMVAQSREYDAITFLDADNWIDSDHIESCIIAGGDLKIIDYIISKRRFVRDDGSIINWAQEPISQLVDTSCFFILPTAFPLIPVWSTMPKPLSVHGDRIFLAALRAYNLKFKECINPTVNYLCTDKNIYRKLGEEPPEYSKEMNFQPLRDWINTVTPDAYEYAMLRMGFSLSGIGTNKIVGSPLRSLF
jgi:glycosyltransferase involved in cell wall biosynthesis